MRPIIGPIRKISCPADCLPPFAIPAPNPPSPSVSSSSNELPNASIDWSQIRESVVLCPGATLEDFPVRLDDDVARGLLASVTAGFHPQALVATETLPVFGRADAPPTPNADTVVWLPEVSVSKLPESFLNRAADAAMPMIRAADREGFCQAAGWTDPDPWHPVESPADDGTTARRVRVDDFYAAGFTMLQVQIMTRRLRYTTNLDEIHVQNRLVEAARLFCAENRSPENHDALVSALHDVFDALAAERDHYFASDPHLVDLTLLPASVVDRWVSGDAPMAESHAPVNLLLDVDAAEALAASSEPAAAAVIAGIESGQIAIAGGGPTADVRLDLETLDGAERALDDARSRIEKALNLTPKIYGRIDGSTPKDLYPAIVRMGYRGVIPIDFAAGTGFGDEAKVILSTDEGDVEALTSRPIDASRDAEFLDIGARLGAAIDSGEIATALLVHFPGGDCDSFGDLVRAASWGLALGRFWKLDDYFIEGERPYHHGDGGTVADSRTDLPTVDSSALPASQTGFDASADPIAAHAAGFRRSIAKRSRQRTLAVATLAHAAVDPDADIATTVAAAIGALPTEGNAAKLVFNPDVSGRRRTVSIDGVSPTAADHIFAATPGAGSSGTDVTVDVPSGGFVIARPGNGSAPRSRGGLLKSMTRWAARGDDKIASDAHLQNEFMDVAFDESSGGIAGVYSARRGNRLSLRIVGEGVASGLTMVAQSSEVSNAGASQGSIKVSGDLVHEGDKLWGNYVLTYSLARGSRCLKVAGRVALRSPLPDGNQNDVAIRIAMPDESSSCRWIVRDKLHRINRRRVIAPAGYVIDQGGKEILVATGGDPVHRRVGERFIDTVLIPAGATEHEFAYLLGLDCPNPVATALDGAIPPLEIPIEPHDSLPEIGYLAHTQTKDAIVLDTAVERLGGAELVVTTRLLQTRAQAGKATLRFCHDVVSAIRVATADHEEDETLTIENDAVSLKLPPHGTTTVRVTLKS